jgi:hypothetical protein
VPIAIGGLGGSGTRALAAVLRAMGYNIGDELNAALDNLWFPVLFRRPELLPGAGDEVGDELATAIAVFQSVMQGGPPLDPRRRQWLAGAVAAPHVQADAAFSRAADSLVAAAGSGTPPAARWGWKAPITHFFAERLLASIDDLVYVHLSRHALDMALSANQNQLRLFGSFIFGHDRYELSPRWSLKFWCRVHDKAVQLQRRWGDRVLLVSYEELCDAPQAAIEQLARAAQLTLSATRLDGLAALVRPSQGVGRHRLYDLSAFDPVDLDYLRREGGPPPPDEALRRSPPPASPG